MGFFQAPARPKSSGGKQPPSALPSSEYGSDPSRGNSKQLPVGPSLHLLSPYFHFTLFIGAVAILPQDVVPRQGIYLYAVLLVTEYRSATVIKSSQNRRLAEKGQSR